MARDGRQVLSRAKMKRCFTMAYGLPQLRKAFSLPFWVASYNKIQQFFMMAVRAAESPVEGAQLRPFSQLSRARESRDYPTSREKSSTGTERRFSASRVPFSIASKSDSIVTRTSDSARLPSTTWMANELTPQNPRRLDLRPILPVFPIPWLPMKVHNSKYKKDVGGFNAIENSIRKTLCLTSPYSWRNFRPARRKRNRSVDRAEDVRSEISSETGFPLFVEINCFVEFGERLRMKASIQEEKRRAIDFFTSSSETDSTRPSRRSCSRRLATAAHSVSCSLSGTLRLRSTVSATAIRSSTGNASISLIISFAVIGRSSSCTSYSCSRVQVTTKIQQNLTVYMAHMRKRAGRTVITLHTDRI